MLKRVFLFIATNIAILVVISIILSIFHIQPYLSARGINYGSLMVFSLIVGFTGSFISLFMSKFIAKMAYSVQIIEHPTSAMESQLLNTIQSLARRLNVGMPEVGIYESPELNAFATGWNRQHALVAVSTGLLQGMNPEELEAVLGHELSHVANGDMITMTLLQGIMNTFVIFFARIAAFIVSNFLRNNDSENSGIGNMLVYNVISIIFQVIFGILASMIVMWFSRYREYRADAGSARLLGKDKMIAALKRLQQAYEMPEDNRAPSLDTMKISSHEGVLSLFASHPPIEKRIEALMQQ
jgi:heat shock protein HtpX